MPRALVVGATGAIGRFLVPRLLSGGHAVDALSRRPMAGPAGVTWQVGDLASVPPPVSTPEVVFSCGPLDAFSHWLERTGARPRAVIAFGSMSALSKQASIDPAERALAAVLADAEHRIARIADARGFAATVLRPTLIYGAGVDLSLTPIARFARRTRLFPRVRAHGLRQPVHADDLAALALIAAGSAQRGTRTYALGGGERIAFADMLERVRSSLPFRTLPVRLPLPLLRSAAALMRRPGFAGAVDRLARDLLADDAAARAELGWHPRGFAPDAACWFP